MVEVASSLEFFAQPNVFGPLGLPNDESILDVETPNEILNRMEKYELQQSTTQSTDHENAYLVKKRTFQEGDLEEGWTIVASRRTRRLSQPIVEDIQTEDAPMKLKPKKWPRSLWTIGAAAAVGLASIFIHRRLQRSQA